MWIRMKPFVIGVCGALVALALVYLAMLAHDRYREFVVMRSVTFAVACGNPEFAKSVNLVCADQPKKEASK